MIRFWLLVRFSDILGQTPVYTSGLVTLLYIPCIAFTGTSIEETDANTLAAIGFYITVYNIQWTSLTRLWFRSITSSLFQGSA